MKKGLKIVLLICLVIVAAASVILLFVIDREKESMTANEFCDEMEDEGYILVDVTSQYEAYGIDEAYIAVEQNQEYQIEFYELPSVSRAENMFATNKQNFKDRAGSSRVTSSYGFGNYDVYSLQSNGDFMYLCRVDNTLLYIDVDDSYKNEVREIIDELDY
ncbi:MAG: hypothetical protein E7263_02950 [Lachnospiraceae bacterium]|nr:hypothetical protein [Lachnospiraceae bacterium]